MADNVVDLSEYGRGGVSAGIPLMGLPELRETSGSLSWLVKHVIPLDAIGVVFGASGTFKSFIALDAALHVAHGLPWQGRKTRQGPVVIVAGEGGAGLWKRIVAWHRDRGLKWADAPVYVIPMAVDLGTDSARVVEAIQGRGINPLLIVVDTMSQTFSGEENSATEVANYLRELGTWLRAPWQASVMVIHHSGHVATERARGSSAIRNNVDYMFSVSRDEKEMLATIECIKQKDGELTQTVDFQLRVIDLAVDEDGDTVSSLAARWIGCGAPVVDAIQHEAQRGRGGARSLFLELALNGMDEKKLRTLFFEAIEGEGEAKRKAYFRARKWAVESGVLEIVQGTVVRSSDGTS